MNSFRNGIKLTKTKYVNTLNSDIGRCKLITLTFVPTIVFFFLEIFNQKNLIFVFETIPFVEGFYEQWLKLSRWLMKSNEICKGTKKLMTDDKK